MPHEMSLAKTLERPDVQFAKAATGLTDEQVLARAKDPDWIQQQTNWSRLEAEHFARAGELAPMPTGVVDQKRDLCTETLRG